MSTLPLTPSVESSSPLCVAQHDIYGMATRCHGLCGLLHTYIVNYGENSKETGHILAGIEMLEATLESMTDALDPTTIITNAGVIHVRN